MTGFPVEIIGQTPTSKLRPTEDGHVIAEVTSFPPLEPQKNRVFSQKFTTDGTATGSDDLGINGSVTPVNYYIPSSQTADRYITRISFIFGYGSSAELYEFADSGAGLTNGVRIWYQDNNLDEVTIMNPKSNYSFQRASCACVSMTGWESRGFAVAADYGYFVNISIIEIMPPYGLKLGMGSVQRMTITIRDDCSDADLFNCNAFGFDRFE